MKKLFMFVFILFVSLTVFAFDQSVDLNIDKDLLADVKGAIALPQQDLPPSAFAHLYSMITAKISVNRYFFDYEYGPHFFGSDYLDDQERFEYVVRTPQAKDLLGVCFPHDNSDIIERLKGSDSAAFLNKYSELIKNIKLSNKVYNPTNSNCKDKLMMARLNIVRTESIKKFLDNKREEYLWATNEGYWIEGETPGAALEKFSPLEKAFGEENEDDYNEFISDLVSDAYKQLDNRLNVLWDNAFNDENYVQERYSEVECPMVKVHNNWLIGPTACLPLSIRENPKLAGKDKKAEVRHQYQFEKDKSKIETLGDVIVIDGMKILSDKNIFISKDLILIRIPVEAVNLKNSTGINFSKLKPSNIFVANESYKGLFGSIYINGSKSEYNDYTINANKRTLHVNTVIKSFPSGAPLFFIYEQKREEFLAGFNMHEGKSTEFQLFTKDMEDFIKNTVSKNASKKEFMELDNKIVHESYFKK